MTDERGCNSRFFLRLIHEQKDLLGVKYDEKSFFWSRTLMKVIKNINNNVAHCSDSRGREVIVFGKGIGFYKTGEDIPLSKINRTFYNVKDTNYGILSSIPTVLIDTSIYIIDYAAEKLSVVFPSSAALTLADHLQFAISRQNQNIYLAQPLLHDIALLYPKEMDIALYALKVIEKMTGEKLPRPEAGTIALHLINDRMQYQNYEEYDNARIIERCSEIIEKHFNLKIDRDSFNYSRFVTHLDFLLRRLSKNEQIESRNAEIFDQLKKGFPQSYECAMQISEYIRKLTGYEPNNEEIMYLIVHINRLISRV